MYKVTPLRSGYTVELMTDSKAPRILIRDVFGVIYETIQFEWWDTRRAERTYEVLVELAGGPVLDTVAA